MQIINNGKLDITKLISLPENTKLYSASLYYNLTDDNYYTKPSIEEITITPTKNIFDTKTGFDSLIERSNIFTTETEVREYLNAKITSLYDDLIEEVENKKEHAVSEVKYIKTTISKEPLVLKNNTEITKLIETLNKYDFCTEGKEELLTLLNHNQDKLFFLKMYVNTITNILDLVGERYFRFEYKFKIENDKPINQNYVTVLIYHPHTKELLLSKKF